MNRDSQIQTVRNQVAIAERVLAHAKACLDALERPEPRRVMVALAGTPNHYAYLVPDGEPTPMLNQHVALPQPFGGGYMIGRVVKPRRGETLDQADTYLRNITWDFEY